jgi:hypothetical protein
MSLQIGAALKRGAGLLGSRAGVVVLAAYAAVMLVYQVSFNTVLATLLAGVAAGTGVDPAAGLVTLPVSVPVAAVVAVAALLAATVVSVVAVRTFVAGERSGVPRRALTDGTAFAVANVLVGGVVFGLVVLVGLVLFVVPGIVAYVGLLFMLHYVAVENDNFVTAMRRSWRLTSGDRIRLFLLVVVLLAVVFLVSVVANAAFGLALSPAGGVAGLLVALVNVVSTLYLLAVLSDAFVQLRDEGTPPTGSQPTTDALGA